MPHHHRNKTSSCHKRRSCKRSCNPCCQPFFCCNKSTTVSGALAYTVNATTGVVTVTPSIGAGFSVTGAVMNGSVVLTVVFTTPFCSLPNVTAQSPNGTAFATNVTLNSFQIIDNNTTADTVSFIAAPNVSCVSCRSSAKCCC